MFDIAVCPADQIPDGCTIIDQSARDADFRAAFPDAFGAMPLHTCQGLMQRMSARLSRRFAKAQSKHLGISVNGLQNAWFHPVFSEVCTLVPTRHLARRYARTQPDTVFAIEIKATSLTALTGWRPNEIEPIYLAYELRRRGLPAFLFVEDLAQPNMTFTLSKNWLPKGYPEFQSDRSRATVLCNKAMRQRGYVAKQAGATRRVRPGLFSRLRRSGLPGVQNSLTLDLREGPALGTIKTFSSGPDHLKLDAAFEQLIGPLTQQVSAWQSTQLAGRSVTSAHISDHGTLEGGLLAAEVTKGGGKVHVWPHSANLVHMDVHHDSDLAQVTMAAKSTAAHWKQHIDPKKVKIDPRAVLPDVPRAPEYDESKPLHVILFAGSHSLRRVPLFNYAGHTRTWSNALDAMQQANVDLSIKHKSIWEDRAWIKGRASDPTQLTFQRTHANKLRLPNMVFMAISATSTALLEGIARGIPAVVVRDIPIEETPHYPPVIIPCLPSANLGNFLADLNGKAAWDALRDRQYAWFRSETANDSGT